MDEPVRFCLIATRRCLCSDIPTGYAQLIAGNVEPSQKKHCGFIDNYGAIGRRGRTQHSGYQKHLRVWRDIHAVTGHDLRNTKVRRAVRNNFCGFNPWAITIGRPCAAYGIWSRLDKVIHYATSRRIQVDAVHLSNCAAKLCALRLLGGLRFIMGNPRGRAKIASIQTCAPPTCSACRVDVQRQLGRFFVCYYNGGWHLTSWPQARSFCHTFWWSRLFSIWAMPCG